MSKTVSAPSPTPISTDSRSESQLSEAVGQRVRKARKEKSMPRRVLSDQSGVSQRYLAQLESGAGNISIGLLQKIATALDCRIDWFVAKDDPWSSDAVLIADMYRVANDEQKNQIRTILKATSLGINKKNRICLIGLRGAGKSTLATLASKELGVPFVELNNEICKQSGMSIEDVMAFYGLEGYRSLEAEALERVISKHDTLILAVAGGIVSELNTYNTLLDTFHTVWVKATPDEHMARVRAQGDERPMSGNPKAMAQLCAILKDRENLYQKSSVQLSTSNKTVDASLKELISIIKERRFLD